jgi:hypothetical protein
MRALSALSAPHFGGPVVQSNCNSSWLQNGLRSCSLHGEGGGGQGGQPPGWRGGGGGGRDEEDDGSVGAVAGCLLKAAFLGPDSRFGQDLADLLDEMLFNSRYSPGGSAPYVDESSADSSWSLQNDIRVIMLSFSLGYALRTLVSRSSLTSVLALGYLANWSQQRGYVRTSFRRLENDIRWNLGLRPRSEDKIVLLSRAELDHACRNVVAVVYEHPFMSVIFTAGFLLGWSQG